MVLFARVGQRRLHACNAASGAVMKQAQSHDAYDMLCLDRQLCFPLYAASNLLGRVYRPLLDPLGLTYSQYLVMLVLWEEGPVHVGSLAQRLYIDSATMTPILKRMQDHGLLTRNRDHSDQRHVMVDLTPRGEALKDRAKEIPQALSNQIGDRLGQDVVESLRTGVRDLVTLLAGNLSTPVGAAVQSTNPIQTRK